MSGNAVAVCLSVLAGLAGAMQVAMMSQLGDRISVLGAVAFASMLTAVVAVLMLWPRLLGIALLGIGAALSLKR